MQELEHLFKKSKKTVKWVKYIKLTFNDLDNTRDILLYDDIIFFYLTHSYEWDIKKIMNDKYLKRIWCLTKKERKKIEDKIKYIDNI